PGVRARIGRELIAGMAQVVNVDALQADSGERRTPDPPPEVGVGQRRALGTGERESTGRNRAKVRAQVWHDQVREVDHAAPRIGSGSRLASRTAQPLDRNKSVRRWST